jgi:hypothetical protein
MLKLHKINNVGDAPTSLLSQCMTLLMNCGTRRPLTRAALLQLLCVWLIDCPPAINHFCQHDEYMTYLTQTICELLNKMYLYYIMLL